MHLKRLQLTGFKTFADRTEILFSPGVTAIVGPNGSGKSNIADSVLWVLGEQKASAVRGVRNQDVIFNGSAKRKQTGLAEVSLTVDNSDGTLPLSFNEVTVTRRALRSGESEYFINKSACRLKDIYELFLDTGVGREAYALVNQSEIDAVLTAAPESRRGLFEEAAGIKKYRVKKREALRKLDSTEQNLSRITDILSEVGSQLAPLHLQAETARKYLELKEQLTNVEENYLISELRTADDQLQHARNGKIVDETLSAELSEQLASAEEKSKSLSENTAAAEAELDKLRLAHEKLRTNNESLHNNRRVSMERLQALNAQEELHRRELSELLPHLENIQRRVAELEVEAAHTGEQSGSRERVQSESEDQFRRLNEQIAALQSAADRKRKAAEALARKRASEEGELARAEARLSEARSSLGMLEHERSRLLQENEANGSAVHLAEITLSKSEAEIATAAESAAEAKLRRQIAAEAVARLRQSYEAARSDALSTAVRLKTLQDLENSQEGYFAGVKAVLAASKAGKLYGRFLVVADSFKAPENLVLALETAFGSSLQDIITDSEHTAKSAIAFLKNGSSGRATFLPLPNMRSSRSDIRLGSGKPKGYLGTALELIAFDQDLRPALESLVGRVLICESLDDALQLSQNSSGWSRIVTLSGELIVPSGAITGGSNNRRGSSLLERKTEISRLEHSLAEQQNLQHDLSTQAADAANALAATDKDVDDVTERVSTHRLQLSLAKQVLDRARRDLQQSGDRIAAHDRRASTANETVRIAEDRLRTSEKLLLALVESSAESPESELSQLRELSAERERFSALITQERIARATLNEKSSGLRKALELATSEAKQVSGQRDRRLLQIEQVVADIRKLEMQLQESIEIITLSDQRVAESSVALATQREVRDLIAAEVAAAASGLRELNANRANALAAARKNEIAETRLEQVRRQLAERLLEEYNVTAEQALALDQSPVLTSDGPREVARLRRELKGLGDVNVGAVEEFDRLSERFSYMTAQKEDAENAKRQIYLAIHEIDDSTRDVFIKTVNDVQAAFQVIFERLFGGGSAQLKLTTPDDLLETGIDILIQLPGKKQQNLQLLSGGERALTAVALLFSFLKVRPAPFCLLDEVDAPLDGANIERFADLLRDFGQTTQFLVITHNPATMEAANVWYGVTMQEPGISRILSLQVPQAGEQAA